MRMLAGVALSIAACGNAPSPTTAPPSPASFCVALDQFLAPRAGKDADLSCASGNGDELGTIGEEPRAPSLTSCPDVKRRARRLGDGTVYDGFAQLVNAGAANWLPEALAGIAPGARPRLVIELHDLTLVQLDDAQASLARAADAGRCAAERRQLCISEPELIEAVVLAKPALRLEGEHAAEYRLPASLRTHARVSQPGDDQALVEWALPIVVATRSATAGFVLGDKRACRGVGGRAPTRSELAAFRTVKSKLALALLGTYQCQMLESSVPMLNALCDGKPCSPLRLFTDIYRRALSELDDRQRRAICESLDAQPSLAACGVDVGQRGAFSCAALAGWLRDHGAMRWCEMGFGSFCGNGILAPRNAPLQLAIVRDMLAHVPADKRACVADRLVAGFREHGPAGFDQAQAQWSSLARTCEPVGCNFGTITTNQPWPVAQRALFERFLRHFSEPGSIAVNPGCSSLWIDHDGSWALAKDGGGYGISPANPDKLAQAAERFANAP